MGKGSGACSRQPLEMETGLNHIDPDTGCPPVPSETDYLGNIDLNLKRLNLSDKVKWVSADYQVLFNKNSKGWYVSPCSAIFNAAMLKIGLDEEDTIFPSLKEAREAAAEAALYSNLSFDPKLKYLASGGYQIGNLPLRVSRSTGSWRVAQLYLPHLPVEIADYFANSVPEFDEAFRKAEVFVTEYPTRIKAVLEVKEWLAEYIKAWLAKNNTPPS